MKIELHTHSSEISPCSHLTSEELVTLYAQAGYDLVVIANHLSAYAESQYRGEKDFIDAFWDVNDEAAETGRKKGITVLGAAELRFHGNSNDYLVFGITREKSCNYKEFFEMGPEKFSEFAAENGWLFYQAHPFRNGMVIIKPEYLFGIEVKNTHPRHDGRNEIASAWAEKFNLHKIAGSDCHEAGDVGTSAIITEHTVKTMDDLVYVLKNDMYEII